MRLPLALLPIAAACAPAPEPLLDSDTGGIALVTEGEPCTQGASVSPDVLTFGDHDAGPDGAQDVAVSHNDCGVLEIDGVTLHEEAAPFELGPIGALNLPPGTTTTLRVTYVPNDSGLNEAEVRITSPDLDEPLIVYLWGP